MTIASPTRFEEPATSPSASAIGSPSRLHLDLFSGIGGFAIAAQACGYQTIGFCETEPYACKILKQTWPDITNYGDIRKLRGIPADLITGGFPCQPYSVAGKRGGASDDRALWPEMLRVIGESKPCWVLGENVAGLVTMELDRVLDDLEHLGYSAWPVVIPACAVDAKHRRDRVWIVAHSNASRLQKHRLLLPNIFERPSAPATGDESGQEKNDVSHANGRQHKSGGAQRHIGRLENPTGESNGRACVWETEPGMGRVVDGIPNRSHRLKGLGNAIVPQIAAEIIKNLVMANDKSN